MPRRAPKVPTQMVYAKKDQLANAVFFENEELTSELQARQKQQESTLSSKASATIQRRRTEEAQAAHDAHILDAKKYIQLKILSKEQKKRTYSQKLSQVQREREELIQKLQAEHDQLKQSFDLELVHLTNTLKANKDRRKNLDTVAAQEIQLKKEIDQAEETLKREKAQQSKQMSDQQDEYHRLIQKNQEELEKGIEAEKAKNRGMTRDNLQRTVIDMMYEKDAEIKRLSAEVAAARAVTEENTELMKSNKQYYMERDLLQKEAESAMERINKNDQAIRKLVEELKQHDQQISTSLDGAVIQEEASESSQQEQEEEAVGEPIERSLPPPQQEQVRPNRAEVLEKFIEDAVLVLDTSVVKILGILDPAHASDYTSFHGVFDSPEGRKKELRFLMSKLGNLTFASDTPIHLPPAVTEIEGADEEATLKRIVEPQKKAILEFAEPIAEDEFPELIATHFFQ